jgi:hypothetical protein
VEDDDNFYQINEDIYYNEEPEYSTTNFSHHVEYIDKKKSGMKKKKKR